MRFIVFSDSDNYGLRLAKRIVSLLHSKQIKAAVYSTDIDTESMILRKGAVSAKADERLLIPMNMRDVSLICIGLGNEKWNYSAPYGAGRLLRRKEAFNSFTMDAYKNNTEVIFTTSVNKDTLDECPMVYKPMEEIMRNINGTVTVNKIIKPIYNFKASENATNKKQIKEMTE